VSFTLVVIAVLKQERLESLACPSKVIHSIRASAAKVTNGLIGGLRNVDGLKVSRAVGAGEFFGITLVGLHTVSRLAGHFGGSDNDAVVAELVQTTNKDKAAWAGFITKAQASFLAVLLAQTSDELFNRMEAVAHLSKAADFPVATGFGNGDGDGVFMDIKTDVE
jgi:hypothetical protein